MNAPLPTIGVTVNGLDLGVAAGLAGADDVSVASLGGWWDGLAVTPATADPGPARVGPAPAGAFGSAGERRGTIALNIHAPDPTSLDRAVRALAACVPVGGRCAVAFDVAPDRVWLAPRAGWTVAHSGSPLRDPWALVTIAFVASPPVVRSAAPRIVGLASSDAQPTAVPLGTLSVWPRVVVTPGSTGASGTTVTLACTDLAGRAIAGASITLTAGLSGSDWLEVDMATRVVTEHLSGTGYASVYAGGRRAAGEYFALDPADGDPAFGSGPSVAVSTPTGSARALLVYPLLWDA